MKTNFAVISGGRHSMLTAKAINEAYQQGREDAIEECIKLFKKMQPKLATNVIEFGDMLEQLKEQKQN